MRAQRGSFTPGRGGWGVFALLIVSVLIPILVLIWLGARASRNEQLALRQALEEARVREATLWQKQLERFAGQWEAEIRAACTGRPPGEAQSAVLSAGLAEGLLAVPPPGSATPAAAGAGDFDETLQDLQFVAQSFGREAALSQIRALLAVPTLEDARLPHGRALRPLLLLLGVELAREGDLPGADLEAALVESLREGPSEALPRRQRRFLLRRALELGLAPAELGPLDRAETLAQRWRRTQPSSTAPGEPAPEGFIEQGGLVSLAIPEAGAVAVMSLPFFLHRIFEELAIEGTRHADLLVLPPGERAENDPVAIAIFDLAAPLRGWRLRLPATPVDDPTAASPRVWLYLWVGALTVLVTVALSLLGIGLVRHQIAVAQLKNDLVATVSHELKTPIASIRLLVDTLLEDPAPTATAATETREYLELIQNENHRLGQLVDKFLTFSRLERNKTRFDFQALPPAALAAEAAQAFRERFGRGDYVLEVTCPEHLPPVRADRPALLTALGNLLENAYKYSDADKRIVLTVRPAARSTVFEVADNGPGIPRHEARRIFERFYQPDRRSGRQEGGVGLGLSIVAFIARRHGGRVEVESEPGAGSRFQIIVPNHA